MIAQMNGQVLREALTSLAVNPDDTRTLLRYAPAALTHLCWRSSIVEDWHAGPDSRISDAEIMRANVSTTRIFRQSMRSAMGEAWTEAGPLSSQVFDVNALEDAFGTALEAAFAADRALPHGVTLRDLGGDELDELYDHGAKNVEGLLVMAEQHGADVAVMWLAFTGRMFVSGWWDTPRWPVIVDEFFRRLDDESHDQWTIGGHPGSPPSEASDRTWFANRLLEAPDELSTAVIEYCIHRAGLGFVRPER